jgi:ribosomal protein S18 acetylase RimI-like enzyme
VNALWLVVLRGEEPIGRLYLDRWPAEHRVIDIALLPAHRGRGYGGALMQDLVDEAIASSKAVSIHVEKNNPARRLYERLGFVVAGEQGVYDRLERRPAAQVNTA